MYFYILVDIALSTLPNATESANRLKDKPEELKKKGQQVKFNMESLQKNINICREMINRSVTILVSYLTITHFYNNYII